MTQLHTSGTATGTGDRSRPRAALPALCTTQITAQRALGSRSVHRSRPFVMLAATLTLNSFALDAVVIALGPRPGRRGTPQKPARGGVTDIRALADFAQDKQVPRRRRLPGPDGRRALIAPPGRVSPG